MRHSEFQGLPATGLHRARRSLYSAFAAALIGCAGGPAAPAWHGVIGEEPTRCAATFYPLADASPFLPGCPAALQGSRLGEALCSAPFLREIKRDFVAPSSAERSRFRDAMRRVLRAGGATSDLRNDLIALGFSVEQVELDSEVFTVVADSPSCAGGRGVFVVREHPSLDAVIEAPHVGFEQETLSEGYRLFIAGARALVLAGTHRCASAFASPCRGSATEICGEGEPRRYRTSDAAAFDETFFHAMHEAVVTELPSTIAVSLHGKREQSDVPLVVLSDGTRTGAADTALSRRVATLLSAVGISSGSCQEPDTTLRLCGTSNVQGRLSNGAANACSDVPTAGSGTFLHVEQDHDKISRTIEQPMVDALRQALPRIPVVTEAPGR